MLPIHVSDTDATSQDGSSLKFVSATAGSESYIQDARCRGLFSCHSTAPIQAKKVPKCDILRIMVTDIFSFVIKCTF